MPVLRITDAAGKLHALSAPDGESVMRLARDAGLPVAGECNGSLACATCHVIVDPDWAPQLAPPGEDEAAMLDTVDGLTATSRLGCQICLSPALDGLSVTLPA